MPRRALARLNAAWPCVGLRTARPKVPTITAGGGRSRRGGEFFGSPKLENTGNTSIRPRCAGASRPSSSAESRRFVQQRSEIRATLAARPRWKGDVQNELAQGGPEA